MEKQQRLARERADSIERAAQSNGPDRTQGM
jgi:hypothetical protein